ncbi:class I SAM-dependent methyltransferase [Sandaracinus amylolyticus]|uniref:class I SAM-dependent methyltransferase n=1 Tax=Sandaracinus amylolyticus TaxID=927083 RepID=UPI001F2CEB35|nr:methyltransferase domain-containing protein [Sandaracinus amylolyticus]UJR81943.1 S-adenosylmethionine-diacylgycerolhomoserine-N-methyltransferase [Sandaracinus amylolyticus]
MEIVSPVSRDDHKRFLDAYYGWARDVYDVTRRYYLLGRDRVIDQLLREPWNRLVEIGPGTGRNLRKLHAERPVALYGGIEASSAMLERARARCPWAIFEEGFAEDAEYRELLGAPPDRVLVSYTLSMVQDVERAIENAREMVSPRGEIVVVDFGDLRGLRGPLAPALRAWLEAFHVTPLPSGVLERHARTIEDGPLGYYRIARIPPA